MAVVQIRYGENFAVDTKFSNLILKNLFYNPIFFEGLTYSSTYTEDNAGQIFVYRILPGNEIEVGVPASDMSHVKIANELLAIRLNNTFQSSKKIYTLQNLSVSVPVLSNVLDISTKQIQESWNKSALCCLESSGSDTTIEGKPLSDDPSVKASEGVYVKKAILDCKTQMYKNKTKSSVVLCSPSTYQTILMAAGKEFTPVLNDQMVRTAEVQQWLGLKFVNCNLIDKIALKYYSNGATDEGAEKKIEIADEEAEKVDFIMYDPMAFQIITNLHAVRFVEDKDFFGTLVQIGINSGYCVTQPKSVIVRKHTV